MAYSITEQMVAWLSTLGYAAMTQPDADAPDSPREFVTVERTGGYVSDLVDHPTMAVQAWAQTEPRAEEIANEVRMACLTGSLPYGVHRIAVNSGPYAFWDEDTRCPRYQLVLDITSQLTD